MMEFGGAGRFTGGGWGPVMSGGTMNMSDMNAGEG